MYHRRLLCAFVIRFLLGIVLGALLLHWQKRYLLYQVGFLNESTLKRLEMLPFQPRVLFLFYLKKCFGYYMMLFLLSASEFRRRGIDLVSISMGILQEPFLQLHIRVLDDGEWDSILQRNFREGLPGCFLFLCSMWYVRHKRIIIYGRRFFWELVLL